MSEDVHSKGQDHAYEHDFGTVCNGRKAHAFVYIVSMKANTTTYALHSLADRAQYDSDDAISARKHVIRNVNQMHMDSQHHTTQCQRLICARM